MAATPALAEELIKAGHTVLVETDAGSGGGILDDEYISAGAEIVKDREQLYARSDMILKVKEPLPDEVPLLRKGQILFAYLHLAPAEELTRALLERGVAAFAYETIQTPDGALPLLEPMSQIAGRMAVQIGAQFLERTRGGRGVLLGGVPGVPPAEVVIIGAGTVGANAARIALGMGAHVTLIDVRADRLRYLEEVLPGRLLTVMSNRYNIERAVHYADLLIGAVLIAGARAPRLVTADMVRAMKEGSVIIDVAVDQGGCVETVNRTTTHADPVYVQDGVLHYAVPNIPGAVPRTSTLALANVTQPYVLEIASKGYKEAVRSNPALARGLNVVNGQVVHPGVAEAHNLPCVPVEEALSLE